jgi:hypothetical protein
MPYAAFHGDSQVVTKPSLADLRALADTTPTPPSGLMIFSYPFESLEPLAMFPRLEVLKIQDSGDLSSLAALKKLPALKVLAISPPPSWERTTRCIEVDSYASIATLKRLERLVLLRVRPGDLNLAPIAAMTHLKELEISNVPEFTLEHYARLSNALPNTEGRCLKPYFRIEGVGFCKKCKGKTVMLNGNKPKTLSWLCPTCNEKKLAEHVKAWEAAKAASR